MMNSRKRRREEGRGRKEGKRRGKEKRHHPILSHREVRYL